MADLIDRQAAKEEILSWAVRIYDPKNLSTADTMYVLDSLSAVDAVEVGSCDGCIYADRKRPRKCSCCRRNKHLKDCYEEEK